ncbi:MAG: nitrogen regulation protein NR(II), partial [Candidatus Zixiibacteriota bacterium]
WFNWDEENKILIVDGAYGIPDIPLTNSGKIDLREIKWDDLILKPFDKKVDFHDIGAVTKALASKLTKNNFLPSPKNGYMAIPIFKYGDLAHIFYLGANSNSIYSEEDISLAKLIISQSAILFEKEKSLLNATRLLTMGNMISEISHDLRRPLTTIKGGLQIIKKRKSEIFQNSELLKNVEDEVYRMNELVRELVDFSNPQKYQTEKVDLRLIINKTSEMVKPDLRKQHIQFQTEFGEADWSVIVNKNQILEVFINLFINAIEAMPKGGQLSINGLVEVPPHKKVEYLALHISDTGVGIKKKNLSKIFDRYFTSKQTGTGLGLAVVERIISAHNGTLKVTSKDGKGTTFSVYFPYGTNI